MAMMRIKFAHAFLCKSLLLGSMEVKLGN